MLAPAQLTICSLWGGKCSVFCLVNWFFHLLLLGWGDVSLSFGVETELKFTDSIQELFKSELEPQEVGAGSQLTLRGKTVKWPFSQINAWLVHAFLHKLSEHIGTSR